MSTVSCKCGICSIKLNDDDAKLSIYCACIDCRSALEWCEKHGGEKPSEIPKLIYLRSDLDSVHGSEYMRAFQLRADAKSTRIYCEKCFSILGVDHPAYSDNVFMCFVGHCKLDLSNDIMPSAAIYLNDLSCKKVFKFSSDLPVFYSFEYEQELQRFRQLADVNSAFNPPLARPKGIFFKDLICRLGDIDVLNLVQKNLN